MELVVWAVFMLAVASFCFFMGKHPDMLQELAKHWLTKLPKAVEKEFNDFTDWKAYAAQGRKLKLEAHADWEAEVRAILQANCEHIYHHQNWYTCYCCGQDEPWAYKKGCSCRYETVTTLSHSYPEYVVTYRSHSCPHHGTDYTSFPLSERKQGPYGYENRKSASSNGYQESQDLQRKLNKRKINFDAFTVSSK